MEISLSVKHQVCNAQDAGDPTSSMPTIRFGRFLAMAWILPVLLLLLVTPAWAANKNVLLIISDDQGLDMGAYGTRGLQTPNLDRLASEGTLFTNGFATVSSCSPSRSVIYSGLYSHSNGMYGLAHDVHNQHLLPDVETLPALLKRAGYATALVGKKHIKPASLLPFDEELAPEQPGLRDVKLLADQCESFMRRHEDKPFFIVVGFSDPHRAKEDFGNGDWPGVHRVVYKPEEVTVPRHLPDLPEVRKDLAAYYESVSRLDSGVGSIIERLRRLGRINDTLIIFMSDNGRPFPGAKTTLYDEGIHLPLIVVSPTQHRRGVRNDALVSWVDVTPTILDWAGAKGPAYSLPGRSLMPVLEQEPPRDSIRYSRRTVFTKSINIIRCERCARRTSNTY